MGQVTEPVAFTQPLQESSAQLLRLQAMVLAGDGFAQAAAALATALANELRCARATVGWLERDHNVVVALSHAADFDERRAIFAKIAAAMDEAVIQKDTVVFPPQSDGALQLTLAHSELAAASNGASLCTVLLAADAQAFGAISFERAAPFTAAEITFCEEVSSLAARVLALKRRAGRSWFTVTRDALQDAWRRLASPDSVRVKLVLAAAAATSSAALFIPVTYHVGAPARLEGSLQRAVVAPFDGYLAQVNVRPGDGVASGQILAELATDELQTERLKHQSEFAQYENAYQAALARADRTELVINHAKAAEATAQLALVDDRLERSRLRAPFDGVVIKGDLMQQVGAPVQRGEVLLTLAPGKRFRLIVEVDEREIAFVRSGQRGRLALAAAPDAALPFTVARVLPVALAAEGRNFFEVEGTLDGSAGTLRPGLRGVAKIAAGERSVAWIASHRLLEWLRIATWSLGA